MDNFIILLLKSFLRPVLKTCVDTHFFQTGLKFQFGKHVYYTRIRICEETEFYSDWSEIQTGLKIYV